MKQQDLLQDQYEDALFALLMDEVARHEGEKALLENERLKNDPKAAVPDATMERCRKTIRRAFARNDRKTVWCILRKCFYVAAIIALSSALLLSAAAAVSPPLRRGVLNLVIEIFDVKTTYSFHEQNSDQVNQNESILLAEWLPEGVELAERQYDRHTTELYYTGPDGLFIRIIKYDLVSIVHAADSENAKAKSLIIQGLPATYLEKGDEIVVTIIDESESILLNVITSGISKNDVLEIAQNIKYK